jgi:hypothetical protein
VTQAPPQYDYYENEDYQTTPKPAPRPKYQQQSQQFASPARPQFANSPVDIIYADTRKPVQQQTFENRQPAQFPQQEQQNAPTSANRADEFSLFTPASAPQNFNGNARADIYKPKIFAKVRSSSYPIMFSQKQMKKRRRKKKKNVLVIVRQKRTFIF